MSNSLCPEDVVFPYDVYSMKLYTAAQYDPLISQEFLNSRQILYEREIDQDCIFLGVIFFVLYYVFLLLFSFTYMFM